MSTCIYVCMSAWYMSAYIYANTHIEGERERERAVFMYLCMEYAFIHIYRYISDGFDLLQKPNIASERLGPDFVRLITNLRYDSKFWQISFSLLQAWTKRKCGTSCVLVSFHVKVPISFARESDLLTPKYGILYVVYSSSP